MSFKNFICIPIHQIMYPQSSDRNIVDRFTSDFVRISLSAAATMSDEFIDQNSPLILIFLSGYILQSSVFEAPRFFLYHCMFRQDTVRKLYNN